MKALKVVTGLTVILNGPPLAAIALYCLPIQSNEQFVVALSACALSGFLISVGGFKIIVNAVA